MGTADFDPGVGVDEHISSGNYNGYLTKLWSDGSYGWTRIVGTGDATVFDVAVGQLGDVFASGKFNGTIDFDPSAGVDNQSAVGEYDAFTTHFKADGSYG